MKKYLVPGILAGLLLVTGGVATMQYTKAQDAAQQVQLLEDQVTKLEQNYSPMYEFFTGLTIQDFEAKVASGADFVVYIGRPDCGDCLAFEPTFIDIITTNNLANKLEYVNVKWHREADKTQWEEFKTTYQFTQTPAFLHFKDGKQVSMIEWSDKGLPKNELVEWFEAQGLI